MSAWGDSDDNMVAVYEREESRAARRFAPETVPLGECDHIGGIKPGNRVCTLCGDGPE